jgi:hypothetical protein
MLCWEMTMFRCSQYEFYETVDQTAHVGLHLRTDTLQYVDQVLGVASSQCPTVSGKVPAFGSRLASAQAGATALTFEPTCLGVDDSLTASSAVNLAGEARMPTALMGYEFLRIPAPAVADTTVLAALGFRTIPYGTGTTAIRATGTMYAMDARFITLEESLTLLAEGVPSAANGQELEEFTGREDSFSFQLLDTAGAVVNRCLRPGLLAANLSLSTLSAAALSSAVHIPCSVAAGVSRDNRPVLTLDALMASAGLASGLSTTDTALTARAITSTSTPTFATTSIPYHLSGISIDVELTYNNLPDVLNDPAPKPLAVTARAVVVGGHSSGWIADSASASPTHTVLPQAAHLSLRAGVTATQCTSLSWSSDAAAVAACVAAVGGDAATAFDTSMVAGQMRSRAETVGAVIRTVATGRVVRFNYTELASLAVQALTKYLAVMSAVVIVVLMCWKRAADTVYTTVSHGESDDGSGGGGPKSRRRIGDDDFDGVAGGTDSKSAPTAGDFDASMSQQDRERAEAASRDARASRGGGADEEDIARLEDKLSVVTRTTTDLRSMLTAIGGTSSGFLQTIFTELAELDKRMKTLSKSAAVQIRSLQKDIIKREAAQAARDAVFMALTGKAYGSGGDAPAAAGATA